AQMVVVARMVFGANIIIAYDISTTLFGVAQTEKAIYLYIQDKWQQAWTNGTAAMAYRTLVPDVRHPWNYYPQKRYHESLLNRLRMLKVRTNDLLHKIDQSQSELCSHCNLVKKAVQHLLCECTSIHAPTHDIGLLVPHRSNLRDILDA